MTHRSPRVQAQELATAVRSGRSEIVRGEARYLRKTRDLLAEEGPDVFLGSDGEEGAVLYVGPVDRDAWAYLESVPQRGLAEVVPGPLGAGAGGVAADHLRAAPPG
jgi:hypothetical protein